MREQILIWTILLIAVSHKSYATEVGQQDQVSAFSSSTNDNFFPGKIKLVHRQPRMFSGSSSSGLPKTAARSLSSTGSWTSIRPESHSSNGWTGVKLPATTLTTHYRHYQLNNKTTTTANPNSSPSKLRFTLPKRNFTAKSKVFESKKTFDYPTIRPRPIFGNFEEEFVQDTEVPTMTTTSTTTSTLPPSSPIETTDSPKKSLKRIVVKKYANIARSISLHRSKSATTTTTTTTTEAPPPISHADLDGEASGTSQSFETYADTFSSASNEDFPVISVADPNEIETGRGASGIDPHHPAVQQAILSHNERHHHSHGHAHLHARPSKKLRHGHAPHDQTSLLPLDKTLVYVGMILSWIFWIVVFTTYYTWGQKHGQPIPGKPGFYKNRPVVLNINQHGHPHFVQARSLDTSGDTDGDSSWNWPQVLYLITLAHEFYGNEELQSLDCQKKALCELSEKQNEDAGNIERKSSNSYSFLDVIEGLPMPSSFRTYLKEYREAIEDRNSSMDCASIYPKCYFSMKEAFNKYRRLGGT